MSFIAIVNLIVGSSLKPVLFKMKFNILYKEDAQ